MSAGAAVLFASSRGRMHMAAVPSSNLSFLRAPRPLTPAVSAIFEALVKRVLLTTFPPLFSTIRSQRFVERYEGWWWASAGRGGGGVTYAVHRCKYYTNILQHLSITSIKVRFDCTT